MYLSWNYNARVRLHISLCIRSCNFFLFIYIKGYPPADSNESRPEVCESAEICMIYR
jgi:hypothetical protein